MLSDDHSAFTADFSLRILLVPSKLLKDILSRSLLVALCCGLPVGSRLQAQDSGPNSESVPKSPSKLQLPSKLDTSGPSNSRIGPEGIPGTLVIVGGGQVPDAALEYFAQAATQEKSVVVITASAEDRSAAGENTLELLSGAGLNRLLATPELGDTADESEQLASLISEAGGVWICGGQQTRLAGKYLDTAVPRELANLLSRGGVIGGTLAGAAIMSSVIIEHSLESPTISHGFALLPNSIIDPAIIDQHFDQRNRLTGLQIAVANHPGRFGLAIDEDTAVIIRGRTIRAVGTGQAAVLLGSCDYREAEEIIVESGEVGDLVQLLRAARTRSQNQDPGQPQFGAPNVANGSLVIVGGGGMPTDVVNRFVELAGGKDAHIVCLPTAGSGRAARRAQIPGFLADAGVASVTLLPQVGVDEVASDAFQEALKQATGVWFGGGRQWNFIDAYDDTNAVELFHQVLNRGGVIGGSSAGATIQGEFLVRGHPLGNTIMMAEGYERGYAFLPGVAIDQHFSQRGRRPDLIPVIQRHPKLLGIGIDEATALVVQGSRAEVIGKHAVHFLRHQTTASGEYVSIESGESIDLQTLVGN